MTDPCTRREEMMLSRSSSLLWKILLSTSISITLLLVLTGWFVQDQVLRAMSRRSAEGDAEQLAGL